MLIALFNVADLLLRVLGWIIIIQVILSWLVAFNVLNTGSQGHGNGHGRRLGHGHKHGHGHGHGHGPLLLFTSQV